MYFFEKKYSKLVQMRAEEKLVCAMPSAAEFREAKNSGCRLAGRHLLCSGVTRTSFSRFVACRSLFVASAWAVNDSLRSNMSPAFLRIARHALCGGVTQPFVLPSCLRSLRNLQASLRYTRWHELSPLATNYLCRCCFS
jgi:hypothetical protein